MLSLIYTEREREQEHPFWGYVWDNLKQKEIFAEQYEINRFARWCAWDVSDTTNTSKKLFSGKRASDRTWSLRWE